MKVKATIRYIGFRAAKNGGRLFDFSVSEIEHPNRSVSVEIPIEFFEGQNRIHLQEGVGISYAKLKHLYEDAETAEAPRLLLLTASDLAQHRESLPASTRRRHGFQPTR